eukprot:1601880-Pleurochrysis_carterae.AAC.5
MRRAKRQSTVADLWIGRQRRAAQRSERLERQKLPRRVAEQIAHAIMRSIPSPHQFAVCLATQSVRAVAICRG